MNMETGELERVQAQLDSIDIPRDRRGIKWSDLKTEPEKLAFVVELKAQKFILEGNILTQKNLMEHDLHPLIHAISNHYPGGMRSLREKLGLAQPQHPNGFWQHRENIETEARKLVEEGYDLSKQSVLDSNGHSSFVNAVHTYYPGKMYVLRQTLGLEVKRRPSDYWSPEQILQEARQFYDETEHFSALLLNKGGRSALLQGIIRRYPGGIRQLRIDLGLKPPAKPKDFWTPEEIRKEALIFLDQEGQLSMSLLSKRGRGDLRTAIGAVYPGRMKGLKSDLGLEVPSVRSKGFWTPEEIERQALDFYFRLGKLTRTSLGSQNRIDLWAAIRYNYLGGISSLKEKLGILNHGNAISPEEANEQLQKLLEEQI